jgi:DGQHR domain-containing protein
MIRNEKKLEANATATVSKTETEVVRLPALEFKQKDYKLYLSVATPEVIARMFYILPNTRQNPDGIQRLLRPDKIRKISEYIRKQENILPTAGIINIEKPINIIRDPHNSRSVVLEFPAVRKTPLEGDITDEYGAKMKEKYGVAVANSKSKDSNGGYGYFIDHQHSYVGVKTAGFSDLELPWIFLCQAPSTVSWKLFADINSKQDKVSKVSLDYLSHKNWLLSGDDTSLFQDRLMEIITNLDSQQDSVLHDKIKIFENDKGRWISTPALRKFVTFINASTIVQLGLDTNELESALRNFFKALSIVYGTAWGDNKNYILCKSMGFYITTVGILPIALRRCINKYNRGNCTVDNFVSVIKDKIKTVKLPEGLDPMGHPVFVDVELDWSSSKFGKYSNEKGVRMIINAIKDVYHEID